MIFECPLGSTLLSSCTEVNITSISHIQSTLSSIDDFDPVSIASFVTTYLLFLTIGFGAGSVIKILRRV